MGLTALFSTIYESHCIISANFYIYLHGFTVLFGTIYLSHCIISANFYIYLQYFKKKIQFQ